MPIRELLTGIGQGNAHVRTADTEAHTMGELRPLAILPCEWAVPALRKDPIIVRNTNSLTIFF